MKSSLGSTQRAHPFLWRTAMEVEHHQYFATPKTKIFTVVMLIKPFFYNNNKKSSYAHQTLVAKYVQNKEINNSETDVRIILP